jgi:hypothetical protein
MSVGAAVGVGRSGVALMAVDDSTVACAAAVGGAVGAAGRSAQAASDTIANRLSSKPGVPLRNRIVSTLEVIA